MPETVSDTGPILHLHEIGRLDTLASLAPLGIPDLVLTELQAKGVQLNHLHEAGVATEVIEVAEPLWREALADSGHPRIQAADAQVFALTRSSAFRVLTLTDDLALRRLLGQQGATVVGSVGILVRAYTAGRLRRVVVEQSIEALFDRSSLHLSRAFRAYVRQLLTELP